MKKREKPSACELSGEIGRLLRMTLFLKKIATVTRMYLPPRTMRQSKKRENRLNGSSENALSMVFWTWVTNETQFHLLLIVLQNIDYDNADWDESLGVQNDREAEERWFESDSDE